VFLCHYSRIPENTSYGVLSAGQTIYGYALFATHACYITSAANIEGADLGRSPHRLLLSPAAS